MPLAGRASPEQAGGMQLGEVGTLRLSTPRYFLAGHTTLGYRNGGQFIWKTPTKLKSQSCIEDIDNWSLPRGWLKVRSVVRKMGSAHIQKNHDYFPFASGLPKVWDLPKLGTKDIRQYGVALHQIRLLAHLICIVCSDWLQFFRSRAKVFHLTSHLRTGEWCQGLNLRLSASQSLSFGIACKQCLKRSKKSGGKANISRSGSTSHSFCSKLGTCASSWQEAEPWS